MPGAAGPTGRYEVVYRVVSADTHVVAGRLGFTVTAPAAASTTGWMRLVQPEQHHRLRAVDGPDRRLELLAAATVAVALVAQAAACGHGRGSRCPRPWCGDDREPTRRAGVELSCRVGTADDDGGRQGHAARPGASGRPGACRRARGRCGGRPHVCRLLRRRGRPDPGAGVAAAVGRRSSRRRWAIGLGVGTGLGASVAMARRCWWWCAGPTTATRGGRVRSTPLSAARWRPTWSCRWRRGSSTSPCCCWWAARPSACSSADPR